MSVIDEPAAAVAAGLCLAARLQGRPTSRHPRRCGWCDYPARELEAMVTGFNEWAGYDDKRGTYERHDARVFQSMSNAEQRRLVEIAQALDPVEELPASEPVEEVPWL